MTSRIDYLEAPKPKHDFCERLRYGNPAKGIPLPRRLHCSIEKLFQYDLSNIRIHFSLLAEVLGALAFTHGTDIYFAPVWNKLSRYNQLFLLGHELAHVIQQFDKRLPAFGINGVCRLNDGHLEEEADFLGHQLAQSLTIFGLQSQPHATFSPPSGDPNWYVVQCYVAIKLPSMSEPRELTDADKAFSEILQYSDATLHAHINLYKTEIMEVLNQWIATYRLGSVRFILGQPAVHRTYESWNSLARALIGEVTSAPNLLEENELAKKTKESNYINDHLASLIGKVGKKVDQEPDSDAKKSLRSSWHKGKYYPWYFTLRGGLPAVMKDPKKYAFSAKVAVLHDLSDYFNDTNPVGATDVPQDKQMAWAIVGQNPLNGDYQFNKVPLGATTTFRHADGTLIEDNPIIATARYYRMPLSYGPSFTTGRLMQLANFSGGSGDEFQAMAWGIFAFWNQDYYTSQSGIHRFHCVMDMASNYGVPYNPFNYPDNPPDYVLSVVIV